jgi:hypothetical protein
MENAQSRRHPGKKGKVIMMQCRSFIVLLIGLAACGPSEEQEQQLTEFPQVTAERDSLLVQVADNARLMNEISAELVRVQTASTAGGAEAPAASRETILANIRTLTARLDSSEARLGQTEKRLAASGQENRSLRNTIRDLQGTIENQKEALTAINEQLAQAQQENVRLGTENTTLTERSVALAEENMALTTRENTVYYVVGTKDDLIRRGLVTEEGGSRVLFVFGKRGKTIVPARDLDPAQFTAIDLREVTEIPLPSPAGEYQIVSRQDLTALETQPDAEGRIRAPALRIADPQRFWGTGRYLIVVQR